MMAIRVVRGVSGHFMTRSIEWFNAAVLLNFGVTLLRPGSTFATSHSYDTLARIATETEWGTVLVLLAGTRIAALTLNGSFNWFAPLSPWARVVTAYFSAFAWFFISAGLFWGNYMAPGPGTYFLHMASDFFIAGVIARDAARSSVGNMIDAGP